MPPTNDEVMKQLLSSMTPLDETVHYFKGLIYGPSGVGKSKLALELAARITPANKKIIYVDSAEGWAVLNNHGELKTHLKGRVTRMSWTSVHQQVAMIQSIYSSSMAQFKDVGTIVYDEFSSMALSDLDLVVRINSDKDRSKSPDQPTLPDYGQNNTRMRRLTDQLIPLDLNIIFLSHEKLEDNARMQKKAMPSFQKGFAENLKQRVHIVARLTMDEVLVDGEPEYRRTLQVQPSQLVDAKSRVGTLKTVMTSDETFVNGVTEWLSRGGSLVDEAEVVTLAHELDTTHSDTALELD